MSILWLVTRGSILFWIVSAAAREPELQTAPLARAFGAAPAIWGAQLSPDGSKISFITTHETGATMAVVLDITTRKTNGLIAGEPKQFEIGWCDWKNDERLLCGLEGVDRFTNRLVAVNHDGSGRQPLLPDIPTSRVIDWLPDDPESVLVQVPAGVGMQVARLNIYAISVATDERVRTDTTDWASDGHGIARLNQMIDEFKRRWYVRDSPEARAPWNELHVTPIEDLTDWFEPVGFSENRAELLYFDVYEGRRALFTMNLLDNRRTQLLFAHPVVDVTDVHALGKYRRPVAVAYTTDRTRTHIFDPRIEQIHAGLTRQLPGKSVEVIDESWDRRYYLAHVSSNQDSGTYYRLDMTKGELTPISPSYPKLNGIELKQTEEIHYAARDGTAIPALLTRPTNSGNELKPAVIIPRYGRLSRDYWAHDFLVQYLAASGYVVVQSAHRGSTGHGQEWLGTGGYQNWRVGVSDIADAAEHLVREGIADPNRICIVGWGYGGYAALLSALEERQRYRCVASIAGVADPIRLGQNRRQYLGGRISQEFIGFGEELGEAGTPVARVSEFSLPLLLFHGRYDGDIPLEHAENFFRSLRRAGKSVELIEYDFAGHSIEQERYRIDMLTRLGTFLEKHLTVSNAGR